jgi:hypothetical protein
MNLQRCFQKSFCIGDWLLSIDHYSPLEPLVALTSLIINGQFSIANCR